MNSCFAFLWLFNDDKILKLYVKIEQLWFSRLTAYESLGGGGGGGAERAAGSGSSTSISTSILTSMSSGAPPSSYEISHLLIYCLVNLFTYGPSSGVSSVWCMPGSGVILSQCCGVVFLFLRESFSSSSRFVFLSPPPLALLSTMNYTYFLVSVNGCLEWSSRLSYR